MALKREIVAVANVLADEANAERSAEDVAALAIAALDELRAKTHRLAVVTNYRWDADDEPRLAVLGPFSTRATSAAYAAGESMAGTPQGGHGKWMAVPAYANARAAWAAIKPPPEHVRRHLKFLESIRAAHRSNPSVWDPLMPPGGAARCSCGLRSEHPCLVHDEAA